MEVNPMHHWAYDSIFYHIYPLGFCGAPLQNDFGSPMTPRLEKLYGWIDHIQELGFNALYLGPVFESSTHGYDTADYFQVDRRLGDSKTLSTLVARFHQHGIKVIFDGVFNHVGRDFWAFKDLQANLEKSAYRSWFHGLSFDESNRYGDPFTYHGWNHHYNLVKLNLQNPVVKDHLFEAVAAWIQDFNIDGLRLDATGCMDLDFLKELAVFCRNIRPDFWLVGEVIHGDYRIWANHSTLDSVTNYECYKGLYSSHNDRNYFEIAYSLNRQFGETGLYRNLPLYAFADNHDVNRVASILKNSAHLYPLYVILFTMPGVPSIYYGSEWGITGKKAEHSDAPLRPELDLTEVSQTSPYRDLCQTISRLAEIRKQSPALKYGNYQSLLVRHEQFAFARETPDESMIVIVNASPQPVPVELNISPGTGGGYLQDLLNRDEVYPIYKGKVKINNVRPYWGGILRVVP
jgi:glycosidase